MRILLLPSVITSLALRSADVQMMVPALETPPFSLKENSIGEQAIPSGNWIREPFTFKDNSLISHRYGSDFEYAMA